MNQQQMFQLFAQRMNLSPEEAAALQSGDYERAFAGRMRGDPMLMSIVSMMQKNRAEAPPQPETAASGSSPRLLDDEIENLQDALQAARTMLRYLAQVLGACRCWGKNRNCARCHGRGAPGFQASSDPQTFVSWLLPGLHALGYQIAPMAQPTASYSEHSAKEE